MIALNNFIAPKEVATTKPTSSAANYSKVDSGNDFRSVLKDSLDRALDKKQTAKKDQANDALKDVKDKLNQDPKDQEVNEKADDQTIASDDALKDHQVKEEEQTPVNPQDEAKEQDDRQSMLALQQLMQVATKGSEQENTGKVQNQTPETMNAQPVAKISESVVAISQEAGSGQGKTANPKETVAFSESLVTEKTSAQKEGLATAGKQESSNGKNDLSNMNQKQQSAQELAGQNKTGKSAEQAAQNVKSQAQATQSNTTAVETKGSQSAEKTTTASAQTMGKQSTAEAKAEDDIPVTTKMGPLDPSKVNIKVAENPTQNVEKPTLPQQVAEKIVYQVNNGKQEFDIQLQPKELGKINVKIVMENGNAQVLLSCSNSKTQHMLLANSDILKNIVESNTGMQTNVHIQNEQKQADQYQQQYDREHSQQQEQQRQQQQEQARAGNKRYSEEEMISFMNQLKFGLLDQQIASL